jgi:hypothetical protein
MKHLIGKNIKIFLFDYREQKTWIEDHINLSNLSKITSKESFPRAVHNTNRSATRITLITIDKIIDKFGILVW